jgi:hypothetical protein
MRVAVRKETPDRTVLDIIDVEDWEEFERTAERVILQFSGRSLERNDGPDGSRRWFVAFGSTVLVLDLVDMVGMRISGEGRSAGELVDRIQRYLERVDP